MTNSPRKAATVRRLRPKSPPSVTSAAASGDEEALLRALQHTLATAIAEGCTAKDLSPLSRRLLEVTRELGAVQARRQQDRPIRQPGPDRAGRRR